jgi:hypothetical protein
MVSQDMLSKQALFRMPVLSDAAVDVTGDSNEPRSQIVIIGGNKSSHQGDVTVGAYDGAQVYNLSFGKCFNW